MSVTNTYNSLSIQGLNTNIVWDLYENKCSITSVSLPYLSSILGALPALKE